MRGSWRPIWAAVIAGCSPSSARKARGDRRPVFGGELFVHALDGSAEDAGADAVALAGLLADAAREYEVARLSPLGRVLVLAKELHQLGLKDDLADAGVSLGGSYIEQAVA